MSVENENRILILELNEVPWSVIDTFVKRHPDSAFSQIMGRAAQINTRLTDTGQLHPKTSWQTFHRGVPDHVHGIREYNQLHSQGHLNNPTLWSLARDAGKRVGCGASIGSWPIPQSKEGIDFWFADPFAPDPESIPAEIAAYQQFNTLAVARSSRQVRSGGVPRKVISDFLVNAPRLGIKPGTVGRIIKQLVAERFNPARAVRRRNIQALMSFDVAHKQWRLKQPHLTTIFINHVAAAMHRYWAAAFPNDYQCNNMPVQWRDTYHDEIDEAMQIADHMLKRLLQDLKKTNTTLLVAGSMGQAAIEHQPTFNQLMIKDIRKFLQLAGMCSGDYVQRPGMEPEYILSFKSAALLDRFEAACSHIDINGEAPEIKRASETECSLLVDQYNVGFDIVTVRGRSVELDAAGLFIEKIDDIAGSTAQHTRDGMAMIVSPSRNLSYLAREEDSFIDLCSVTASVLKSLDIPVPDYMPEPANDLVRALQSGIPGTNACKSGKSQNHHRASATVAHRAG